MKVEKKEYFAHGKRGVIHTGFLNGKKVAVKSKRESSEAKGRIKNEAVFLKKLNKHGIGPTFISFKENELIYEFVKGRFIMDFFEKASKKDIREVIKNVLTQCYKLDSLGINKEEMHHPVKHIIVEKGKPVMIDFERCHYTKKPKNVTQFCQFLISEQVEKILNRKGLGFDKEKMKRLAQEYKRTLKRSALKKIIALV